MNTKELASHVLPIIQSYESGTNKGEWVIDASTQILIPDKTNVRLNEIVELIIDEYKNSNISVSKAFVNESEITKKDIVIHLEEGLITNKSDSKEAYTIDINERGLKVTGASENAIMYALRTIQQLCKKNNNRLVYGLITDYPDLEERRLHVDMGRKYFTKEWFLRQLITLSKLKINTLQLHFAENLGFRIESEVDPQIVSQDGYLKKSEVKEIIAEAAKYGIQIIPSLDTPGHVEHILKTHPAYGQIDINGNRSKVALDVTNEEAVTYIKSLYTEYMELFKESTHFHIGADEYMEFDRPPFTTEYKEVLNTYAKATFGEGFTWKDAIANYINEIAAHVYAGGFKPRIFNDGVYYGENDTDEPKQQITMHDYIGIDFWSQMGWNPSIAPLNVFIQKGHQSIYNLNANFFYYVLRNDIPEDGREQHSFDHLHADEKIYNEWTAGMFDRNEVEDDASYIKGAQLSVWCDNPSIVSEEGVAKDISKELRTFATKTWNMKSDQMIDYPTFVKHFNE